MSFTGSENHSINLEDAAKMTENYRNALVGGTTLGGYFGRDAIQGILAQNNCVGIRIYYALDENGVEQFVVVGVKEDGDDLYDGEIAQHALLCPPYCPQSSPLNGTA